MDRPLYYYLYFKQARLNCGSLLQLIIYTECDAETLNPQSMLPTDELRW